MTAEPAFGRTDPRCPSQVDLRLDPALGDRLPFDLPMEPNTWLERDSGGVEALWLGPDEWLIVDERGSPSALVAELEGRLSGVHHSAVDVSANRAAIDLTGARRLDVLAQGCGLDLDPDVWRHGMCAQTLLARVPVILRERNPGAGNAGTRVYVRPSYVAYLTAWLDSAADAETAQPFFG